MNHHLRALQGNLVAKQLAGSWRRSVSPCVGSEASWGETAGLLTGSGAGGLAWWRLCRSELQACHMTQQFKHVWWQQSLQAVRHARNLKQVISELRGVSVEPVLVKGWSIARRYPELGLRPYGDFDLCVLPGEYEVARAALQNGVGVGSRVDLHLGFGKFYDKRAEALFDRSQLVMLDDVAIRVLAAEDELRFLCLHLLRHGASRPLWLCDIAVAIETRGVDFDWDLCLGPTRLQASWVVSTIGLAHRLLGAHIDDTPVASAIKRSPRWLVPTVLRAWGQLHREPMPLASFWRRPVGLFNDLPYHWPNPIEATMAMQAPINGLPRLPLQIGDVVTRVVGFSPRVVK